MEMGDRWPVTSLVSGGDLGSRDGAAKQWRTKRTQRFGESKWMWRLGGVTGLPSLGFGPGECDYGERRGTGGKIRTSIWDVSVRSP